MKKIIAMMLVVLLAFGAVFALTACEPPLEGVELALAEAAKMTREELAIAAKEEIGTNKIVLKGASSGIKKAADGFSAEYGIDWMEVESAKDSTMYEQLGTAMGADTYYTDVLLLQDTSNMMVYVNTGDLLNYIPKELGNVPKAAQDPLTCIWACKQFTYTKNSADEAEILNNVWQLTGATGAAGQKAPITKLYYQDPTNEGINMSMFVMLTHEDNIKKLEDAYTTYFGEDYTKEGDYETIAHKFIAEFIGNVSTWHTSDTTASKNLATGLYNPESGDAIAPGTVAYVPFAKQKNIKGILAPEGGEDRYDELWPQFEFAGLTSDVAGFNGFAYKMYLQVPRTAKYPLAAALFIDYIMTSDGFNAAWGGNFGYYSGNEDIAVATGDTHISNWDNMLIEDPTFIYENFATVSKYVKAQVTESAN